MYSAAFLMRSALEDPNTLESTARWCHRPGPVRGRELRALLPNLNAGFGIFSWPSTVVDSAKAAALRQMRMLERLAHSVVAGAGHTPSVKIVSHSSVVRVEAHSSSIAMNYAQCPALPLTVPNAGIAPSIRDARRRWPDAAKLFGLTAAIITNPSVARVGWKVLARLGCGNWAS